MATPLAMTTQLSSLLSRRRRSSNHKVFFNACNGNMTITLEEQPEVVAAAPFSPTALKATILRLIEELSDGPLLTLEQQKVLHGLRSQSERLRLLAESSDYGNVPANGYRSTMRALIAILEVAKKLYKPRDIEDFISIISYGNSIFPHMEDFEQVSNVVYQQPYDAVVGQQHFCFLMDESKRVLKPFLNQNFLSILFDPSLKPLNLAILRLLSSFTCDSWTNSLYCLSSHEDCASQAASYFIFGIKMSDMKKVMDLASLPPVLWSLFVMRNVHQFDGAFSRASVSEKEEEIPSRIEIHVHAESFQVSRRRRPERFTTQVKYYTVISSGTEYSKKVVFYLHGGGFVGPKAEAFHDLLLKDMAVFLPGVTIVNLDFPSAVDARFPCQLQQILDLYLQVVDEDHPLLGYSPTDIVLFGDSSGGHLAADLLILLNDIKKDGLLQPRLPRSFVTWFPKFFTRPQVDAGSMFISFMDGFFLNPFTQKRIIETVGCYRERDDNGNWHLYPSNKEIPSDWFHDPNFELLNHPYLSPLYYNDFEGLRDVSLHVLAVNFCGFIQESIAMCKLWKGKVSLQAVDSVPHGFYFYSHVNSHCRKATEDGFRIIREAFTSWSKLYSSST